MWKPYLLVAFVWLMALPGCLARFGPLGTGPGRVLIADGEDAPGHALGPHPVTARGTAIGPFSESVPVVLYRPADLEGPLPAVVFLPGRVAPERLYESYARALASHGMVVAVRGWYTPFETDWELAHDANEIADWLVRSGYADPDALGVAGHSMGGKNAVRAAAESTRYKAVVAIDPDDNGRVSVVHGSLKDLKAAFLVVGAEWAYKANKICGSLQTNYKNFFEHGPPGTVELELKRADHMQVMDTAEYPGMGLCRIGTADTKQVRVLSRQATVNWFVEHLLHAPVPALELGSVASLRVRPAERAAAPGAQTPGSSRKLGP